MIAFGYIPYLNSIDFLLEVLAHEIAHKWWGHLVRRSNGNSNKWLREGFAEYSSLFLYHEFNSGKDHLIKRINENRKYYCSVFLRDNVELSLSNDNRTLNYNDYFKGAYILHMLRYLYGDELFFQALKSYAGKYRWKTVTTPDFINTIKEATGEDISWFWDQWYYGTGIPEYKCYYFVEETDTGADLWVKIEQHGKLYKMPVEIFVDRFQNESMYKTWIDNKEHYFRIRLDSRRFKKVIIDKELWILRKDVDYEISKKAINRYHHLYFEDENSEPVEVDLVDKYFLFQNFPNPFNISTKIKYDIPNGSDIKIKVYDITGKEITKLESGYKTAGEYSVIWDGTNDANVKVSSGIYLLQFNADIQYSKTIKMVYLK
ncbi:M1 family aminopeptidase [candidate division KSB1 bacterium]